jgi:two-component system KDP operon response regulator KdpE
MRRDDCSGYAFGHGTKAANRMHLQGSEKNIKFTSKCGWRTFYGIALPRADNGGRCTLRLRRHHPGLERVLTFVTVFGRSANHAVRSPDAAIFKLRNALALAVELQDQQHRDSPMAAYAPTLRPLKDDSFAFGHAEKPRILVVNDGKPVRGIVSFALESAGYRLYLASADDDALLKYQQTRTELIVLKLDLPETNGPDLVRRLRKWTSVPIIVISVRDQESEMIGCLEAGADDYLTKPVSSGQVVARVRAVLRRTFDDMRCEAFIAGHLRVEFDRREVFVAGGQIRLTATEYHLLVVMVRHAGRVRTHRQLVHEVWGSTQYQDAVHLLRVTVSNLRRKLASDSGHELPIVTEPGVGYRLRADSSHASSASFAQAT